MCQPEVLLFLNLNKLFVEYFDPEKFFLIIKLISFRGDLPNISAKKKALPARFANSHEKTRRDMSPPRRI